MPRIVKKKKIKRTAIEEVCERISCDFCGLETTKDQGTAPGVVDWGPSIGDKMTVCWAMWNECESDEDSHEIVICPSCFLELEKLIPEIRKLMNV